MQVPEDILLESIKFLNAEENNTMSPHTMYERVAKWWMLYLNQTSENDVLISSKDVAMLLMLSKMVTAVHQNRDDVNTYVHMAAYAAAGGMWAADGGSNE